MKEFVFRVRVPENVYKKIKIFCVEKDVSLPKFIQKLIEDFLNKK